MFCVFDVCSDGPSDLCVPSGSVVSSPSGTYVEERSEDDDEEGMEEGNTSMIFVCLMKYREFGEINCFSVFDLCSDSLDKPWVPPRNVVSRRSRTKVYKRREDEKETDDVKTGTKLV